MLQCDKTPLAFIASVLLAMIGYFLVRPLVLKDLRPLRWWRVLPVKFFGGMGTLGAGRAPGHEGPMVCGLFCLRSGEARHTLLATGAVAKVSATFNALLAAFSLIIEKMRSHFHYNLISIKAVFTGGNHVEHRFSPV